MDLSTEDPRHCVMQYCAALSHRDQWTAKKMCSRLLWESNDDHSGKSLYRMVNRGGVELNCGTHFDQSETRAVVLLHGYLRGADYAFHLYALVEREENSFRICGITDSETHGELFLEGVLSPHLSWSELAEDPVLRKWAERQATNISRDAFEAVPTDESSTHVRIPETDTLEEPPKELEAVVRAVENSGLQIILVGSAVASVGKSTIANWLSQELGCRGKRVLLVDGDLRNPRLTRDQASGEQFLTLNQWLRSNDLSASQVAQMGPQQWFIPGAVDEADIELVQNTPIFGQKIHAATSSFDYVIIDTTPVLAESRLVNLLGAYSAFWNPNRPNIGVLYVSSFATLPKLVSNEARALFEAVGVKLIAEITNHHNASLTQSRLEVHIERCVSVVETNRAAVAFRIRKEHEKQGRLHWMVFQGETDDWTPIGSDDDLDLEGFLTINQPGPWARFD